MGTLSGMTSTEFAPISSDNLSVQLEDLKALCDAQRRELFELRQQHETDQALIRQLEGDAATDREAIANLETALGSMRERSREGDSVAQSWVRTFTELCGVLRIFVDED